MSKSRRSREKESFWRLAIEEHRKSGLSVREFCLQEGLSAASFYAWRRKLGGHSSQASSAVDDEAKLIPVEIVGSIDVSPDDVESHAPLELVTPNGYRLRFPPTLPPCQLGGVLVAVAQSSGAAPC